jgi:hypothetical protein
VFAVVRIKVEGIKAESMPEAITAAEASLDYYNIFDRETPHQMEFAEEISHFLVDQRREGEDFDSEIDPSEWFSGDGETRMPGGHPESTVELMSELVDHLSEAHQDEIDNDHHGDDAAGCSYCDTLRRARDVLKSHGLDP